MYPHEIVEAARMEAERRVLMKYTREVEVEFLAVEKEYRLLALFRVLRTELPDRKIFHIKAIRAITGMGLKEAKDWVEARWEETAPDPLPF